MEFTSIAHGVRVHAGQDALARLAGEMRRLGCRRPVLLCGGSVLSSGLPARIAALLPDAEPDVFAGLKKEAPLDCVLAAVEAARRHGADCLVAIGAGSVLKAARVVAILLAEDRPVEQLVTRYPAEGPAVSARLPAPKMPIFNVLTAATTAQCRGGSALSAEGWDQRLEFFDPKTRPQAIFWDADALMTAPDGLVRDSAAMVYWRALTSMAVIGSANPLVRASRREAWRIAQAAARGIVRDGRLGTPGARIELCAATLLQNRDEDDGGSPMQAHRAARVVYALGAALFTRHPQLSQAAAYSALTCAALEEAAEQEPAVIAGIAEALLLPADTETAAVIAAVREALQALGQPTRLRDLPASREGLAELADFAGRSFNADRNREFQREPRLLRDVLELAW